MELLVKPEMLTSYIYGPTFGNAETVSFYLLHNVSALPNVGPYIYMTLAFLALLGAPYVYEISSLRVNIIKWQVKFNPVA